LKVGKLRAVSGWHLVVSDVICCCVSVANKEDMANAILINAIQNIASMTVWTALAKNCRTVYLCGGVFEHQLPRDLFFYFFQGLAVYFGKVNKDFRNRVCLKRK